MTDGPKYTGSWRTVNGWIKRRFFLGSTIANGAVAKKKVTPDLKTFYETRDCSKLLCLWMPAQGPILAELGLNTKMDLQNFGQKWKFLTTCAASPNYFSLLRARTSGVGSLEPHKLGPQRRVPTACTDCPHKFFLPAFPAKIHKTRNANLTHSQHKTLREIPGLVHNSHRL
jgi:hypothetical protein